MMTNQNAHANGFTNSQTKVVSSTRRRSKTSFLVVTYPMTRIISWLLTPPVCLLYHYFTTALLNPWQSWSCSTLWTTQTLLIEGKSEKVRIPSVFPGGSPCLTIKSCVDLEENLVTPALNNGINWANQLNN